MRDASECDGRDQWDEGDRDDEEQQANGDSAMSSVSRRNEAVDENRDESRREEADGYPSQRIPLLRTETFGEVSMDDGVYGVDIVKVVDGANERIPGGQVSGAEEKVTPVEAVWLTKAFLP